jgi:hypothetical protein
LLGGELLAASVGGNGVSEVASRKNIKIGNKLRVDLKVLAKPEEEILLVLPINVDEASACCTQELGAAFLN